MALITESDITDALRWLNEWEKLAMVQDRHPQAAKCKQIAKVIKDLSGKGNMFETAQVSTNHPEWLCITNLEQINYSKTNPGKNMPISNGKPIPIILFNTYEEMRFESYGAAARYLNTKTSCIKKAVDMHRHVKGWSARKE